MRRLPSACHFRHQPFEHAQMSVTRRQVDDSRACDVGVADVAVGVRQHPAEVVDVTDGGGVVTRGNDPGSLRGSDVTSTGVKLRN